MPDERPDDTLWLCVPDADPANIHAGGTLAPAGFTLADVLLVVEELTAFAFDSIGPEASKSRAREALDKFPHMVAALLKEKPDAA